VPCEGINDATAVGTEQSWAREQYLEENLHPPLVKCGDKGQNLFELYLHVEEIFSM
jgi:hypothetical protein